MTSRFRLLQQLPHMVLPDLGTSQGDKGNDYHEHECPNEHTDPSRQSCVAQQGTVRKTFEAKPIEASFAGRQGVDFDFIKRECRKHYSSGHVADGENGDFEYGNRESANHLRSPQAVSVVDSRQTFADSVDV